MTPSLRLALALSSRSIGDPRRIPTARRHGALRRLAPVSARQGNREGQGPQGLDPALEAAVPVDQRPVNELAQLKEAPLCGWVRPGPACRAWHAPLNTTWFQRQERTLKPLGRAPGASMNTTQGSAGVW